MEEAVKAEGKVSSARRRIIRVNFAEAFKRYVDDGHNIHDLISYLGISEPSLRCYYRGAYPPSVPTIREICSKLGWDFNALSNPAFSIDKTFELNHLSYDILNKRILSRMEANDNSGMQYILSCAASKLHGDLQNGGVPCELRINKQFEASIIFDALSPLVCFVLNIAKVPEKGIKVVWEYNEEAKKKLSPGQTALILQYELTDEGLKKLLHDLQK